MKICYVNVQSRVCKVSEWVYCEVCKPVTQRCNHVKWVWKLVVSFFPSTSTCDGDMCTFSKHFWSFEFVTSHVFDYVMWQSSLWMLVASHTSHFFFCYFLLYLFLGPFTNVHSYFEHSMFIFIKHFCASFFRQEVRHLEYFVFLLLRHGHSPF